jgi:hypothetical protein
MELAEPVQLFDARSDVWLIAIWVIAMLLIGASEHFGKQSSDFSALEFLAPF